jgi:hypothetical protein
MGKLCILDNFWKYKEYKLMLTINRVPTKSMNIEEYLFIKVHNIHPLKL